MGFQSLVIHCSPYSRLRLQRRVGARVVPLGDQHQRVGVAGGVAELLVAAAGVEPAAGDVDRAADLLQRAEQVVVVVVARGGVDVRLLVGEVGGLPAEDVVLDVSPVAFRGEVAHRVVDQLAVQGGSVRDREGRRRRSGGPDPVAATAVQSGERQQVDRLVAGVPGADVIAGDAAVDDLAVGVDDGERDAGDPRGEHHVGGLGRGGLVADLVEADLGGGLFRGGRLCGGRLGRGWCDDARAEEAAGTARVARVVSAASVIPARRIICGLP